MEHCPQTGRRSSHFLCLLRQVRLRKSMFLKPHVDLSHAHQPLVVLNPLPRDFRGLFLLTDSEDCMPMCYPHSKTFGVTLSGTSRRMRVLQAVRDTRVDCQNKLVASRGSKSLRGEVPVASRRTVAGWCKSARVLTAPSGAKRGSVRVSRAFRSAYLLAL